MTQLPPDAPSTRAFTYVRVSSDAQTKTDYSQDGLSIEGQREAAADKARQLGAEIVQEFPDAGRSAYTNLHKRTSFLAMLDALKRSNRDPETKVDYVIVYSLSRWARNTVDHWQARAVVKDAGARLVSITEPMAGEDSAAAFLYESNVATNNQYQSMLTSENVRRGLKMKASLGGWTRQAPLGYLNDVDRLPDGRRVKTIVVDPDRGHFITLAFELYASGEYSIKSLANELERLGLRARPDRRSNGKPLGTTVVHRLLRNRVYIGQVVYKPGKPEEMVFEGRHEPLVDRKTFDRVQALLDDKRVAGERPQVHQHYLRGSVFCDACGARLVYGLSRSRNGNRYAYYFCVSRVNGPRCEQQANIRPELIEKAIAEHYRRRPVQLSAKDAERRRMAIEQLAAASQSALEEIRAAKAALIDKLMLQQQRLLRLHAEEGDDVSPEAFRAERRRMQAEIQAARQSLEETDHRLNLNARDLAKALELATDVAAFYREADELTKRRLNQAFFTKMWVRAEWDDGVNELRVRVANSTLTEPYALLLADGFADDLEAEIDSLTKKRPKKSAESQLLEALFSQFELRSNGTATGIRTPVSAVRGRRPSPLDDGGKGRSNLARVPPSPSPPFYVCRRSRRNAAWRPAALVNSGSAYGSQCVAPASSTYSMCCRRLAAAARGPRTGMSVSRSPAIMSTGVRMRCTQSIGR